MNAMMLKISILNAAVLIAFSAGASDQTRGSQNPADVAPMPVVSMTIDDLIIELLKAYPNLRAGVEDVPSLNDVLAISKAVHPKETEAQAMKRISRLVAIQTDYECRYYDHWLVVVPQTNKEKFDTPVSLRKCITPTVQGVSTEKFLRMLKSGHPEEPVKLYRDSFFIRKTPKDLIFSKERTAPCYKVLSDITEQLSLRCWRINHSYFIKPGISREIEFPLKLIGASVMFHDPAEVRAIPSDKR